MDGNSLVINYIEFNGKNSAARHERKPTILMPETLYVNEDGSVHTNCGYQLLIREGAELAIEVGRTFGLITDSGYIPQPFQAYYDSYREG